MAMKTPRPAGWHMPSTSSSKTGIVGVNTSNNNDVDFADEVAEQLDMLEESLNSVES